jgi:hypothetical protein
VAAPRFDPTVLASVQGLVENLGVYAVLFATGGAGLYFTRKVLLKKETDSILVRQRLAKLIKGERGQTWIFDPYFSTQLVAHRDGHAVARFVAFMLDGMS